MMQNPLRPAIIDGFVQAVLLLSPVFGVECIFLFLWTGLPLFLLYACIGAGGNVVLTHSLRVTA